ncbi:hypothetical protein [Bradyrhizobium japonicum]|uniref:hypothetical protein n=1 Tax=Bradyrhizobium japonicum TaxID=375 RepID=UPI00200EE2D2|nr:hypothetical protein [Bradyrhizobium japonicum]UQE03405.1 hypothetical protein JEY30_48895 [Bradyrhizobium japonicum]
MAETTELRTISLIGPKLALKPDSPLNSTHFCWNAQLSVSYLGINRPDLSLVNSTLGLRVVLQAPESDPKTTIKIKIETDKKKHIEALQATIGLRTPFLLAANVQARQSSLGFGGATHRYVVRAAKPEDDPDIGKITLGFATLLVAPLDPWPTPQTSVEIEVPRLALAANRLRVLVSAKGGTKEHPLGFLRLAQMTNATVAAFVGSVAGVTDLSKLPRIEIPAVTIKDVDPAEGPFIALDLTPDGIEFRGTVANPLRAFGDSTGPDRIKVVLRLTHIADPLRSQSTVWTLELVREEDDDALAAPDQIGNRIRQALSIVRSKFHPSASNPLFLDIDTVADDLAVRWPLELKDKSVGLFGKASNDWLFWVDRSALRGSLNGSPVRDGELSTEVAIVPNRIELSGSKTGVRLALDADRRDVSLQDGDPDKIAGPKVTLTSRTVINASIAAQGGVTWFLDQHLLARNLVERYSKAGVHPDGATRTYAFLPVTDGWLQLPLNLPDAISKFGATGVSDAVGFEGSVEYVLDDETGGAGPIGRRIAISAADYVRVSATFKGAEIEDISVELSGAAGTADGVLWLAAGSPSPQDILPGFDAGPAALASPPVAFRRGTIATAGLLPLLSSTFTPGKDFKLTLPKGGGQDTAYLWPRYVDMPLVTAIGMTRTSESSGAPSATRGLVCRELDLSKYDIILEYDAAQGIPKLSLSQDTPNELPLAGKGLVAQVPLVPVTLPGIELQPAGSKFPGLKTRLRYDLPVLDELFANTRLPEKAPVPSRDDPVPLPPPDAPTSLDFDRLLLAWQKAVDRLGLSRVQIASAFEFSAQAMATVPIRTLVEGITWSPSFSLDRLSRISGTDYAFGTFSLDGEKFSGRIALQGLTKTFAPGALNDIASGTGDPIKIVGWAAALREQKFGSALLWRDTRAALMARMPTTERFGGDPQGIIFREAGVMDIENATTLPFSYATIFEPVEIQDGDATRKLGLWFRDLPLKTRNDGKGLALDPDGPELSIGPRQSAYDRLQLPRAIYEWRFCNDAVNPTGAPPSAYEIDIGPLRLRPLRLLDLHVNKPANDWQIDVAKILFTVSLKLKGASTRDKGPFEPELAYATGNLVAISLTAAQMKLGFGKAKWEDVQVAATETKPGVPAVSSGGGATVSFRMTDIPVKLGSDTEATGSTTAVLGLTIKSQAGNGGIPEFSEGTLDTVLLGRSLHLEHGAVRSAGEKTIVAFAAPPATALKDFSGVLLNTITVEITDAKTWTLLLDGVLKVTATDPYLLESKQRSGTEVISYTLGGSLGWLNQQIPAPEFTVAIDHQRGVVSLRSDWSTGLKSEPIVGLSAENPVVRAILVVALGEQATEGQYAYRSVSGFGEFNLTSKPGPTTRLDHLVVGKGPLWSSEISVDLALKQRSSRIRWPIGSLPDTVKTLGAKSVPLANLGARVTGEALRGRLTALDASSSIAHSFTMKVTGQAIETSALGVTDMPRRVAFAKPWSFHALTEHTLEGKKGGKDGKLTWTSLDHVSAVDARALVAAAKSATKLPQPVKDGIFAFAARYKVLDTTEDDSIVVKAGLVLRAFAQAGFPVEALAKEIAKVTDIAEGIVISGAGPSMIKTTDEPEGPFWPDTTGPRYLTKDPQGIFLALPWLVALDNSYALPDVLQAFDQAPPNGTAAWDAPDVDWAAGSPTTLGRKAVPAQATGNSSAEIAAMLKRVAHTETDNRALAAAEQVFLRRFSGAAALRERPIWLRSLLALRTLWNITLNDKEVLGDRVVMVVPSGKADGKVARVRLLPRRTEPEEQPSFLLARHGLLVAIDRNITKCEPLPPGELIAAGTSGGTQVALSRMRQVARADRLVEAAVAIIVVAESQKPESGSMELWINIDVPRDLDDSALDIPIKTDPSDRLYASPALGWPTGRGTRAAASGALGMGGDWPFQDIGPGPDEQPQDPNDVKQYGSGLSGRAASISLPARADRQAGLAEEIDTVSPPFYTLGRKMIFNRPASADLPLVSPPARYLTSSDARAVVPVALELHNVLSRVVKGKAAPIVPPHLERITFGLRPGAIQAEFDMLMFTDGVRTDNVKPQDQQQEDMSAEVARYGRPGHGGPRLMRQLRPPRGPALPRMPSNFVKNYGRRTFLEIDDLEAGGTFAAPFRLFEGVASVLRRNEKSYRVRVLDMPLTPEWTQPALGDWKQGSVTLDLSSPSYPKGKEGDLAQALASLGLLRDGPKGFDAALSINRFVVPFNKAVWSKGPNGGGIRLTLHAGDISGTRPLLDEVDGDSEVVLQLRCGRDDDSSAPPPANKVFELATQPPGSPTATDLEPETRRQIALRLPVRPTARPSLNIDMSTLVFADPSYDRELSGPGPSDPQRDNAGVFWKVALDRFEYGADTPLYFAFGSIDATTGGFSGALKPDGSLQLQRKPFKSDEPAAPVEPLLIAGVTPQANTDPPTYSIKAIEAYGISFDQLRRKDQPVAFTDGDEIIVAVSFTRDEPDPSNPATIKKVTRTLSCRAKVVSRPIIAPPPAVYSLVVPGKANTARVVLHATAPLPQRIEFPALLSDLAIGHIRRQALFVWPTSNLPALAPDSATLVKIDRAGGGQLPERVSDLPRRERLPKVFKLRLECTDPPESKGREADLLIALDNGPWLEKTSTWNCAESQVVFFNTRDGTYKAGGNPNLVAPDGVTGVGVLSGFDAETARVGSKGIGQSLESPAKFAWTVIAVNDV